MPWVEERLVTNACTQLGSAGDYRRLNVPGIKSYRDVGEAVRASTLPVFCASRRSQLGLCPRTGGRLQRRVAAEALLARLRNTHYRKWMNPAGPYPPRTTLRTKNHERRSTHVGSHFTHDAAEYTATRRDRKQRAHYDERKDRHAQVLPNLERDNPAAKVRANVCTPFAHGGFFGSVRAARPTINALTSAAAASRVPSRAPGRRLLGCRATRGRSLGSTDGIWPRPTVLFEFTRPTLRDRRAVRVARHRFSGVTKVKEMKQDAGTQGRWCGSAPQEEQYRSPSLPPPANETSVDSSVRFREPVSVACSSRSVTEGSSDCPSVPG